MTDTPGRAGETLHRLLHAYRHAMRDGYARADINQTVSHIRVLKSVAGQPGITASTIATHMRQDKGRIARLLKDLETGGLVERRAHPQDSRSRRLWPTTAGTALRARIAAVEAEAAERMTTGLAPQALETFTQLAETLIANLDRGAEPSS